MLRRGEVIIRERQGLRRLGILSLHSEVLRIRFWRSDPLVIQVPDIECIRWSISANLLTLESGILILPKGDEFEPFPFGVIWFSFERAMRRDGWKRYVLPEPMDSTVSEWAPASRARPFSF